jgi:hypothetical protein
LIDWWGLLQVLRILRKNPLAKLANSLFNFLVESVDLVLHPLDDFLVPLKANDPWLEPGMVGHKVCPLALAAEHVPIHLRPVLLWDHAILHPLAMGRDASTLDLNKTVAVDQTVRATRSEIPLRMQYKANPIHHHISLYLIGSSSVRL